MGCLDVAKRFPILTMAPPDDASALSVKACSPDGPLLVQVAKLMPHPNSPGRFVALGRVFSGTVGADKCVFLDGEHIPAHPLEGMKADDDAFGMDGAAGEPQEATGVDEDPG